MQKYYYLLYTNKNIVRTWQKIIIFCNQQLRERFNFHYFCVCLNFYIFHSSSALLYFADRIRCIVCNSVWMHFPNVFSIFSVVSRQDIDTFTEVNYEVKRHLTGIFSPSISFSIYFPLSVVVSFPLELMCPFRHFNSRRLDFLSSDSLHKCARKCNCKNSNSPALI